METQSITPFYLDKALWVTVLTPVAAILSAKLGVQLDTGKLAALVVSSVIPAVAFIISHKAKSMKILLKELELKALSQVTVTPESK